MISMLAGSLTPKGYLGGKPAKGASKRPKKRRLAHPCDRLDPEASDRGIHASLHFCGHSPEVATTHYKRNW